jgi:hypothetical protein
MNKKFIFIGPLLLFIFGMLPLVNDAQTITFQQIYQGNVDRSGRDVIQTSDGGYLLAAMTENSIPGDSDMYIIKTNPYGDTLWTKTYGGNKPEYPYSALELGNGDYFILGYTDSYGAGDYDLWLLRINSTGTVLWSKTYGDTGDDQGKEIIPTSDGNYLLAGRSNGPGTADYDGLLIKIDPAGNELWKKFLGGTGYETIRSVAECSDGGFAFTGQTTTWGSGNGDIWLAKTNSTGDLTWSKTFGGTNIDDGNGLVVNSDGSIVLTAETNSFGSGLMDVQVLKTDDQGNQVWNKFYGGTNKDVSKTIVKTTDGGYFVGCISRSFGWINPEMWLLKLDASGDLMWSRNYGSWDHEHCHSAKQTSDGGYIALGHTKSYGPFVKIMLVKLDQFGTTDVPFISSANSQINVFPNPTDGKINIELPENNSTCSYAITNMVGEIFANGNTPAGQQTMPIDLQNLQAGVYFLRMRSENHFSVTRIVLR